MRNQVLILLIALSEHLEALGCKHSALHELRLSLLLQVVLLVGKVVLPLIEAVAHVGLLVLLAIGQEVEPVFHNLAHLDPAAPPVEHLRLQVVVRAVAMPPAGHRFAEQLKASLISVLGYVLYLVVCEAFVSHELAQILAVHLHV